MHLKEQLNLDLAFLFVRVLLAITICERNASLARPASLKHNRKLPVELIVAEIVQQALGVLIGRHTKSESWM